jgi:hypothetical protein
MGLENRERKNYVGIELSGNSKSLGIINKETGKGDMFGLEKKFCLWRSFGSTGC